jgi:2-oxoglutarate dehydrogenase E2 component (dihydrolipoamide succinyltransferase)
MPAMGEGVIEGTIARWLKEEGDPVALHDPLVEVETDKVTTEVTAEMAGTLVQILAPAGSVVPVGEALAVIAVAGESADSPPPATIREAAAPPPVAPPASGGYTGRISPVVARMAAEHGLDLARIPATGRDGRITKQDVQAWLAQRGTTPSAPAPAAVEPPRPALVTASPSPVPPAVAPGAGDVLEPMTTMRRAIADHMVLSKRTSPHVTTVFDADFTAVLRHRAGHKAEFAQNGINLTITPYIVMAIAAALRGHPLANSVWTEEGIVRKGEIHIGMATAIAQGLIVPVIRHADELSLTGMARRVNDLAERARANRLQPAEVKGGTFSLTNHGTSGSLFATPIINQPQCGILGVGKIEKRVVVVGEMIAIRPMAYLSFTFDHRILDGASADYFVATVKQMLEGWGQAPA